MSQEIYTLVRPVLDYEESESTYAAFPTQAAAQAAKEELTMCWNALLDLIGEEPEDGRHSDDPAELSAYNDAWFNWTEKRDLVMNTAKLPFGATDIYRYDIQYRNNSAESAIEVRAVPLFTTPEASQSSEQPRTS